jgi:hypothetical protein
MPSTWPCWNRTSKWRMTEGMHRKRYLIYQQVGPDVSELIGRVLARDEAMPFPQDLEWRRSIWNTPAYYIIEEWLPWG